MIAGIKPTKFSAAQIMKILINFRKNLKMRKTKTQERNRVFQQRRSTSYTLVTSISVPNYIGRKTKMVSLCYIYGNEKKF